MSLHRLLEEQRETLEALDYEARAATRELLEETQARLRERLAETLARHGGESYSTQVIRTVKAQVDAASQALRATLAANLESRALVWGGQGLKDILDQVSLMDGPVGGAVRLDLALGLQGASGLRRRKPFKRFGEKQVQRFELEIARSQIAKLPRQERVGRIIEAADKSIGLSAHHAALIDRNELSNAYDRDGLRAQVALSERLKARGSEGLLARMDEARDRRSHAFSIIAHGTVAPVGEPWKVSVAEVMALAKKKKLGAGGVVWRKDEAGEFWVGDSYIAHHNDRGRRTAFRKSWGDPRSL